jgi:hypothetical protein
MNSCILVTFVFLHYAGLGRRGGIDGGPNGTSYCRGQETPGGTGIVELKVCILCVERNEMSLLFLNFSSESPQKALKIDNPCFGLPVDWLAGIFNPPWRRTLTSLALHQAPPSRYVTAFYSPIGLGARYALPWSVPCCWCLWRIHLLFMVGFCVTRAGKLTRRPPVRNSTFRRCKHAPRPLLTNLLALTLMVSLGVLLF